MPALILTGHPCVGKTTFAQLLGNRALLHPSNSISNVVHIRECTSRPDHTKAECYSNSHMEKSTRASLKSEFDRAVMSKNNNDASSGGGSTLVILDSLNYIKGYRYELYCISKAAGERHGVVWIMGSSSDLDVIRTTGGSSPSDELAKARNRQRRVLNDDVLDGYYQDDETIDALVLRYEPPDDKNRWENPLYKVDVTGFLPWGKDGTLEGITSQSESNSVPETATDNMTKDDGDTEADAKEVKSVIKSAAGFKRRGKKSTTSQPPQTAIHRPQSTAPIPTPPSNIPSSMASRNFASGVSITTSERCHQSKRKIEDVIDGILDSFLVATAPLQEGMSTLKLISAESDVLNKVDNLTQRANNEILKAQKAALALSDGEGDVGAPGLKIIIENGTRRRTVNISKPLHLDELRNCRRQFLKWTSSHPMQASMMEEDMVDVYISYIESNI